MYFQNSFGQSSRNNAWWFECVSVSHISLSAFKSVHNIPHYTKDFHISFESSRTIFSDECNRLGSTTSEINEKISNHNDKTSWQGAHVNYSQWLWLKFRSNTYFSAVNICMGFEVIFFNIICIYTWYGQLTTYFCLGGGGGLIIDGTLTEITMIQKQCLCSIDIATTDAPPFFHLLT